MLNFCSGVICVLNCEAHTINKAELISVADIAWVGGLGWSVGAVGGMQKNKNFSVRRWKHYF